TRFSRDWSSDVCSSDLKARVIDVAGFPLIDQYVLEKMALDRVQRIIFKTNPNRNPKKFPDTFTVFDPSAASYLKRLGVILIGTRSEERRVGKDSTPRDG